MLQAAHGSPGVASPFASRRTYRTPYRPRRREGFLVRQTSDDRKGHHQRPMPHDDRRTRVDTRRDRRRHPFRRGTQCAQLPPAARRRRLRRGRLDDGCRGPPLSRHAGRLLGAQFRPRQPPSHRGGQGPAGASDPDVAGLPPRPLRAVLYGARRVVRQGHGAADEHRGGGGGDRRENRPQVGLQGQGRERTARPRSWSPGTTSTAVRPRSSASRPTRRPARTTAPTRRASRSSRTATSPRCGRRSPRTPWPCCSNPSRARRACWCRRPDISRAYGS